MPTIMPKVRRSRRIWMSSFSIIAMTRPGLWQVARSQARPRNGAMRWMKISSSEGLVASAVRRRSVRHPATACSTSARSVPLTWRLAPKSAVCTPSHGMETGAQLADARAGDPVGGEPGALDHLGDRATGEDRAVGEIDDAVAALRLVHVVGRDEDRDAAPASLWISSQKSRRACGSTPAVGSSSSRSWGSCIMQAARARRCFQPPGEVARELALPLGQPKAARASPSTRADDRAGRRGAPRSPGSRGSSDPRRS